MLILGMKFYIKVPMNMHEHTRIYIIFYVNRVVYSDVLNISSINAQAKARLHKRLIIIN